MSGFLKETSSAFSLPRFCQKLSLTANTAGQAAQTQMAAA